VRFVG